METAGPFQDPAMVPPRLWNCSDVRLRYPVPLAAAHPVLLWTCASGTRFQPVEKIFKKPFTNGRESGILGVL